VNVISITSLLLLLVITGCGISHGVGVRVLRVRLVVVTTCHNWARSISVLRVRLVVGDFSGDGGTMGHSEEGDDSEELEIQIFVTISFAF
jgi:hypothetical protein